MGLCKCERKQVTTLFCFEHRVNVCEFCLVSNHNKCIIKSYLRWLSDSNFTASCYICHERFDKDPSKECVRLICLDVFHWDCLNGFVSDLPPTTTPAGYICPLCSQPIIPQANHGGPVAEALRVFLKKANWAQNGIGDMHPFHSFNPHMNSIPNICTKNTSIQIPDGKLLDPLVDVAAKQFLQGKDVTNLLEKSRVQLEPQPNTSNNPYHSLPTDQCQRRDQTLTYTEACQKRFTDDEDKYKRRPTLSSFRWLTRGKFPDVFYFSPLRKRRTLLLTIFLILFVFLLVLYNSHSTDFNGDPLLDPHMNPNIRLDRDSADAMKVILKRNGEKQLVGRGDIGNGDIGNLKEA